MLILITYDLKSTQKNYVSLYESIKNLGLAWWHYLDSVWLIDTQHTPDECTNSLRELIDTTTDNLFIVDITEQANQGWLPSKAWEWIKQHNHS